MTAAVNEMPVAEDEMYSAENLRRIARSLSGTVIGGRSDNLVPSRSFVSFTHNQNYLERHIGRE